MAKFEKSLTGNFDALLNHIEREIMGRSSSATYEDGSDITIDDVRMGVRVYERYSMMGGNRVSLNITLVGKGDSLFVSAITSGGSQAMLFKINTIGEETFLGLCQEAVESFSN